MQTAKELMSQLYMRPFDDKIDPYKYLFGRYINTINTLDADEPYAQHNFGTCNCGPHSITVPQNVMTIADYLLSHNIQTHCDVGGSRGMLSAAMLYHGIDSYCIDGCDYGLKHGAVDIPIDRYSVFNFTSCSINDFDMEKHFDFTTSFEITEHISPELIDLFYQNIAYMSKDHLCSIHVGGLQETNHYLIRDVDWWLKFFSKYGTVKGCIYAPEMLQMFDESYLVHITF